MITYLELGMTEGVSVSLMFPCLDTGGGHVEHYL
jgi:hypothetical protein